MPAFKLLEMLDRKLFFFGGKGGVGKTTLSSALALALADRGRKTLIISTDPAHSLSDILGVKGEGIFQALPNLYVCEIDPYEAVRGYMKKALESIEPLVNAEVFDQIKEAFHSIEETPGTEEAATLEELTKLILGHFGDYEHFVIDTAPTGHTLQMLKTASRIGRWLEELLKRKRTAQKLWSASGKEKEDRAIHILEERRKRFLAFSELLLSRKTIFFPVLNPERLPIEETYRMVNSLKKLRVNVGAIIVNKVLPPATRDEFFTMRKEQEKEYMKEIREKFKEFPIVEIPMKEKDIEGVNQLREVSVELGRRLGI
ncbi:arsenite efflux ATP-binding protein ArsA [Hydrogenivirga caldilitoris]|uniref:arsenite-transporting ATPase n=1 Tax=Hydrogenivirga caldilitoris TaxID=246264 RepID=A0A497XPA4_9AQUI|nr:TRC40/GET3/ArsA family transport-energizing ATPase [Hydrogenivirga caldilitoris]RLJ70101.1 arsenite efflux ATP-binding protein ArsA [Hydrogenivirga caldilitoris]